MFASMQLGRLPHDPAVIARMPSLDGHELLAVAGDIDKLERQHFHFRPAMDDNNIIGDCTCVGYANGARAAAALHGYEIDITTQQVLALYSRSCGYVPGNEATDRGGVLADVLAWQARHGFDATNQMLVGDFATVDPANLRAVRKVTNATGLLYCGVELAVADQNPIGGVWDTDTPASAGDATPGSWGGHCLTAETRIPLLNGSEVQIGDIAAGTELWVYSCSPSGRIVPGRAHALGRTRRKISTVRIILDNGETIRCSPDHPFMLRDGAYRPASELRAGDSLMPLYRRVRNDSAYHGYEECLNPQSGKWVLTHRLIASDEDPQLIGLVVHHADFNKRNNEPTNLSILSWQEHTKLHQGLANPESLVSFAKSARGRQQSRELMQKLWADPEWARNQRARLILTASQRGRSLSPEQKLAGAARLAAARLDPAIQAKARNWHRTEEGKEANRQRGLNAKERYLTDPEFRAAKQAVNRKNAERMNAIKWGAPPQNHSVVSVQPGGEEDVYDLNVEQWHNFAVGAGVFVHNCLGLWDWTGIEDTDTVRLATWGMLQRATWRWVRSRMVECHALTWRDIGGAIDGVDYDKLKADITTFLAG